MLNLVCGDRYFNGYVNADFFTFNIKFWKRKTKKIDWMLDLRYPLKCSDNYWDGIFCEHTLEHLTPVHAFNLLRELFRVLKPGCFLRITVPDLEKYIAYYCKKNIHENFKKCSTGAEAIRSLTQNWGHRSVWYYQLLSMFLSKIGFVDVKRVAYGEGRDENLLLDFKD